MRHQRRYSSRQLLEFSLRDPVRANNLKPVVCRSSPSCCIGLTVALLGLLNLSKTRLTCHQQHMRHLLKNALKSGFIFSFSAAMMQKRGGQAIEATLNTLTGTAGQFLQCRGRISGFVTFPEGISDFIIYCHIFWGVYPGTNQGLGGCQVTDK